MRFRKRKPPKPPVLRYTLGGNWWYEEGFSTWEAAETRQREIEGYMEAGQTFRTRGGTHLVNASLIQRIWINDVQ